MSGRGKRSFDPMSTHEEGQRESKRPALASVIVEALKVDSLHKLCSSLEPILRRVVSEEVERALAKLGPARTDGRVSPGRIEGPDGRNLQIQFKSKLSLPLFTGGKVEGEQGSAIHVVLFDRNAGQVVTSGPESSVRLNVVVLEGDFNKEDEESWSQEEFESHIVVEREGRRPLLTGDLQVALKEGVGTLGDLTFTDNSSWVRSRKFRLGLKVASGNFRILEASTEAFSVRDHRGELYKKHYPPSPNDEVWRLEKIGKDGSFHKRLNEAGIYTVQDFLRLVILNHQELRRILGTGMSNKMWDSLVEHSKTCVLSGKHYVYYPDEAKNVGVVFNNRYELSGLIAGGEYRSIDSLSENQKVCVDSFVKNAYENWGQVIEYDSESLMGFHQDKALDSFQNALPDPISAEISRTNQRSTIEGYDANIPMQLNMNIDADLASPSFSQHNQHFHSVQPSLPFGNENLLSLGPSIPTMPSFPTSTISNLNSYRGFEDTLADEIRVRSHEMLEGEDMQHLLRMYSIGRHGYPSFDATENSYAYPGYAPFSPSNFMLEEDRTRPTGKAVVGWLKLKAALRWGIFIRKQAAERRAHIVDLEDL